MENPIFSKKDIETTEDNLNENEETNLEPSKKIIFDYDQLNYIKFKITFFDGFNFGLGIITAILIVSLLALLIFIILGFSLSHLLLKALM